MIAANYADLLVNHCASLKWKKKRKTNTQNNTEPQYLTLSVSTNKKKSNSLREKVDCLVVTYLRKVLGKEQKKASMCPFTFCCSRRN